MLPDSGSIQESEVAALNRRNAARGRRRGQPDLYPGRRHRIACDRSQPVEYETWIDVIPGVRARYWNAGHLLGSASIELEFEGRGPSGRPLRLLASGDVGPDAKLLEPDPKAPADFDYVISESTYGDRIRAATTPEQRRQRLAAEVRDAAAAKGAAAHPGLRGRTHPGIDRRSGRPDGAWRNAGRRRSSSIRRWPSTPPRCSASMPRASTGTSTSSACSTRRICGSPRPSTKANRSPSSPAFTSSSRPAACATPAGSGITSSDWLWNSRATVLLVGFQAHGTLGRFLQEGAKAVRIQGDEIKVAARIRMIDDYSGHADGPEMARWIAARRPIHRGRIPRARRGAGDRRRCAERLAERIIPAAKLFQPVLDDIYELSTAAPTLLDVAHRRRLAPEAVVASRLAQRHVETGARYQRPDRGGRRRPRPRRHHPAAAPRAGGVWLIRAFSSESLPRT